MIVAIRVEKLNKRFGDFVAVRDMSFEVPDGSLVALLGPSGGGKSTVLRMIAGLEEPDSGHVHLDGLSVNSLPPRDRKVGFVFQHYALFRHMTVAENIGYALKVKGAASAERKTRVNELLEIMGLHGLGDRLPSGLSGGQRQRVALARSLAARPRLLLLDEPFAAVDAKVREELRLWLRRLHDEVHVTSLFVTHDQDEAFALADRVLIINGGKLEQAGTPEEILENPATEFVARFIGEVNVLDADVRDGIARVGNFSLNLGMAHPDSRSRVIIRSYDLKFWRNDDGPAVVQRVIPLGDRVRIEAEIGAGLPLIAQFPRRSSLLHGIERGSRIGVEVTRARAYPTTQNG